MAKTLSDLLKNEVDIRSVKGLFSRIGHDIVGERLIDGDLITAIESGQEKTAAEYIADLLFYTSIVPGEGDKSDNNLDHNLTVGKVCSKYDDLMIHADQEFRNIANYLIGEQILVESDLEAIKNAIKLKENLNGESIPASRCADYIRDQLYNAVILPNGSMEEFLKSVA
ncbi:Uncharacterised protein [uncultured archaeon]|nr:Uncharacterised protein [uncultured archaeon]